MMTLLSPSKSVTNKKPPSKLEPSDILFPDKTKNIVQKLRGLSEKNIAKELQVSDTLAKLNYDRYQQWGGAVQKPAIWLYSGDVYNGLNGFTMSESAIQYAQNHVLIISGLYGLVRPLDGIQPYRLEMKLPFSGSWGKNLYDAWSDTIASYILETNETTLLMCASKEYAKAVLHSLPDSIRVVTPRFMQYTNGKLQEKGLFAKYARGALARWAVDNQINAIEDLQKYNKDGFSYSYQHSSQDEIVYIIPNDFSLKGRFTKQ